MSYAATVPLELIHAAASWAWAVCMALLPIVAGMTAREFTPEDDE